MKVFKALLQEIKEKKLSQNDDSCEMKALVKRVSNELLDEKYKPSQALKSLLAKLMRRTSYPMEVAIIGQFSSGKSTFLNALLGRDVLPTGITPVTSKVNFINYGDEYKIEVTYNSGMKEFHGVEYLSKFTDQRESLQDIKYLSLFAPVEMLRDISFVDTPGLNSLSSFDTNTTIKILRDVDGIIWLGLIDAVAKKTELDILDEYLDNYANKSICLLNQKDRISAEEVEVALKYAKDNYKNFFSKIIAISAKEALDARLCKGDLKDSNMQEVLEFINEQIRPKAYESKLFSLKQTVKSVIESLQDDYTLLINLYVDLVEILEEYDDSICSLSNELDGELKAILRTLNLKINDCIEYNSLSIYGSIKSNTKNFAKGTKSILGVKITKQEYKSYEITPTLFDKTKMKNIHENIDDLESKSLEYLNQKLENFEKELILWKTRVLKTQKRQAITSDEELFDLKYFASAIYEQTYHFFLLNLEDYKQKIKYKINKLSFLYRFELAHEKTISQINFEIINMQNIYEKDSLNSVVNSFDEKEILQKFKENLDFEYLKRELRIDDSFINTAILNYSKGVNITSKEAIKYIKIKFNLLNDKVKYLEDIKL